MNPILSPILELLPEYGPWLLFALAVLETSFVTGLVVPSGLATSAATVLALEGRLELVPVVVAALCGGALGDTLGFWIGRRWGGRVLAEDSRWSRRLGQGQRTLDEIFGRHPAYSVTGARLISFVRTLMPMAAGMSGLRYRRFLPYELVGLLGWGAIYVLIGVFAQGSWQVATRVVGVGGTLLFLAVGLVTWALWRRRRSGTVSARPGPGSA